MTNPISDERLAEIRKADAESPANPGCPGARDRRDLLAHVDVLRRENERLGTQVADYENRITWHTTCQQCATTLDAAIADHERAEQAEARLAEARRLMSQNEVEAGAADHLAQPAQGHRPRGAARRLAHGRAAMMRIALYAADTLTFALTIAYLTTLRRHEAHANLAFGAVIGLLAAAGVVVHWVERRHARYLETVRNEEGN